MSLSLLGSTVVNSRSQRKASLTVLWLVLSTFGSWIKIFLMRVKRNQQEVFETTAFIVSDLSMPELTFMINIKNPTY